MRALLKADAGTSQLRRPRNPTLDRNRQALCCYTPINNASASQRTIWHVIQSGRFEPRSSFSLPFLKTGWMGMFGTQDRVSATGLESRNGGFDESDHGESEPPGHRVNHRRTSWLSRHGLKPLALFPILHGWDGSQCLCQLVCFDSEG